MLRVYVFVVQHIREPGLGIGGDAMSLQQKNVRYLELNGLLCATPTSMGRF